MELTDQTRAGISGPAKLSTILILTAKARFPNLPNVEYDLPISALLGTCSTADYVKSGS